VEDVWVSCGGTRHASVYYNTCRCQLFRKHCGNTSIHCRDPVFHLFVVWSENGCSRLMYRRYRLFVGVQYMQEVTTILLANNYLKSMTGIHQSLLRSLVSSVRRLRSNKEFTTTGELVHAVGAGTMHARDNYNINDCQLSKKYGSNNSFQCRDPWFLPFIVWYQYRSSFAITGLHRLLAWVQFMQGATTTLLNANYPESMAGIPHSTAEIFGSFCPLFKIKTKLHQPYGVCTDCAGGYNTCNGVLQH